MLPRREWRANGMILFLHANSSLNVRRSRSTSMSAEESVSTTRTCVFGHMVTFDPDI